MSQKKKVQKKALKKSTIDPIYPRQVATKLWQIPMSDADFIRWIAVWAYGKHTDDLGMVMDDMLNVLDDGRLSKKQYNNFLEAFCYNIR